MLKLIYIIINLNFDIKNDINNIKINISKTIKIRSLQNKINFFKFFLRNNKLIFNIFLRNCKSFLKIFTILYH